MKILGNIIWLVFGGIIIAIEYFIGSLILMITIIGIPFGLQTLKMASLSIWPFGRSSFPFLSIKRNLPDVCLTNPPAAPTSVK